MLQSRALIRLETGSGHFPKNLLLAQGFEPATFLSNLHAATQESDVVGDVALAVATEDWD